MATTMQGADIAQLNDFAILVDSGAATIGEIRSRLSAQLEANTAWQGMDAATFKNDWNTIHQAELGGIQESAYMTTRGIHIGSL